MEQDPFLNLSTYPEKNKAKQKQKNKNKNKKNTQGPGLMLYLTLRVQPPINCAPTTQSKEPGVLSSLENIDQVGAHQPVGDLRGWGSASLPQVALPTTPRLLLPARFFPSFLSHADAPQTDENLQACLEKSERTMGPIRLPWSCPGGGFMGPATPARGKQEEGHHADEPTQERAVARGGVVREQGISPPRENLLHHLVTLSLREGTSPTPKRYSDCP